MKVVLAAASTPNGIIAGKGDNLSFITQTEWQGILKRAYDTGNCVMGYRTYKVMLKKGKFPFNCLNVVMTKRKQEKNKWPDKVLFTGKSPKEVLKMLEQKGFSEVFVLGGGHLNASFIKQKLVDEIVLDLEPWLFTEGTKMLEGKAISQRLKPLEARLVSPDEIRVVYKVEK
ncbi:MAG: dihydrofolate reductase family protein [Candidatus Micrarchaeia archaeon]